jgi:hypothetical protein
MFVTILIVTDQHLKRKIWRLPAIPFSITPAEPEICQTASNPRRMRLSRV